MQALLAEMFERQQTGKLDKNVLDDKSTKTFGLFKNQKPLMKLNKSFRNFSKKI